MSDSVSRLRTLNAILLMSGNDYSDTLLDSAAEIERLRNLLYALLDSNYNNMTFSEIVFWLDDLRARARNVLSKKQRI